MKRFVTTLLLCLFTAVLSFARPQEYKEHRVKWYESLSSIARKYDVTPQEILTLNGIKDGVIYPRQILKIPVKGTDIKKEGLAQNEGELTQDSLATKEVEVAPKPKLSPWEIFSQPKRVSLILPFASQSKFPSANNLDFYSGALIAVNQLKDQGLNIELNVIDLASYSWRGEIFHENLLEGSHLVVGPIDSASIGEFASYCKDKEIPFVSPLDHKAEAYVSDNPYFFQVPTSTNTQLENLISQIRVEGGERLTVFYNAAMDEAPLVNRIKSLLDSNMVVYDQKQYAILQGRTIIDDLKAKMSRSYRHKVIVASENEAFASDVVRNMKLLTLSGYDLEVYCTNKVRNFGTIDAEFFHDVNLHSVGLYYVDYYDEATNQFVKQYRALFNCEPTPFAFQGYDIFKYFLTLMSEVGTDFSEYAPANPMSLLQTKISFEKVPGGGYINKGTRNIEYLHDYIVKVK